MITAELKDAVLKFVCENYELEGMKAERFSFFQSEFPDLSFNQLNAILSQFQSKYLIEELNARPIAIWMVVKLEAHDFLNRGGFRIQEDLFQSAYNKLQLEVESLAKDFPQRAERFTNILANFAVIGTAIGVALK